MDALSIVLLAFALAMDCLAVSITKGIQHRQWSWYALLMAVCFGLFQGGMPLIGYFAGALFSEWVCKFDHWIALLLLSYLGIKMIIEGRRERDESKKSRWSVTEILLLSIATSIDALATGLLFVPVPEVLWAAVATIGAVSLVLSLLGYVLAYRLGRKMKLQAEIIGGIVLIIIGVKIFVEDVFLNA